MYNISGATLPIAETKNRTRTVYYVFSFFYFSVADRNRKEPMIYGLIVAALLPCASY